MQEEYHDQVAIVQYLRVRYPNVLFTASAGGMRTGIRTAVKMKAAGYLKGCPDLMIFEKRHGYAGLFIELKKRKGGKVSPHQKEWIRKLRERGYYADVCHGYDEAVCALDAYFIETKGENEDEKKNSFVGGMRFDAPGYRQWLRDEQEKQKRSHELGKVKG